MATDEAPEVDVRVGWQDDGSYVPCPECGCTPAPDPIDFGTPMHVMPRRPGTAIHRGDCPKVPQIDQETRDRLVEMDRVRRRGAAEARNYVIG